MIIGQEGKVRCKKIDQLVFHEMCAQAVIEHNLPYSFVEYQRIIT